MVGQLHYLNILAKSYLNIRQQRSIIEAIDCINAKN